MAVQLWHRSKDGILRKCDANVKPCPFSVHFDSLEDGRSRRQRVTSVVPPRENIVPFATVIGGGPHADPNEMPRTLRTSSENARKMFIQYGQRPCSPLGTITVNLPTGRHIVLTRETYDLPAHSKVRVGVRYYVRLFRGDHMEKFNHIEINNPGQMKHFETMLQSYFTLSKDYRIDKRELLGDDFSEQYEQTMQVVSEVEGMARGARQAHELLEIDLFSKNTPGVLTLDTTYSGSVLQPYDVSDSLGVHAASDDVVNKVEVSIKENIPGGSWTLSRLPEGDWYIGSSSNEGTGSQKVNSSQEGAELLERILVRHNIPESERASQRAFVEHLIQETENSINNYTLTTQQRLSTTEPVHSRLPLTVGEVREQRRLERERQANDLNNKPDDKKTALNSVLKLFS